MTTAFDPHKMRLETVGRPLLKNMTKIVDDQRREIHPGTVGELAQRLPSNMLGYHNAPSLTAGALDEEGWYYTGDQAVMDERGYVRIVGRKKDMIIRGGQNVFPAEIEQFLLSREGIKNAAAVGLPHPLLGESIWLFVELQEDSPLTAEGIMALCREHLSPSKRPDRVKIVDALPVTASGKVQKYLLKDRAVAHE
jgi:fatty-acyl-CoA synthase